MTGPKPAALSKGGFWTQKPTETEEREGEDAGRMPSTRQRTPEATGSWERTDPPSQFTGGTNPASTGFGICSLQDGEIIFSALTALVYGTLLVWP